MAYGTGSATITFPVSAQVAQYETTQVVSDSEPNPNQSTARWAVGTLPSPESWTLGAHGNGRFVLLNANNTNGAYSDDGVAWTGFTGPATGLLKLSFGGGVFVAVDTSSTLYYSYDGLSWLTGTHAITTGGWAVVAYGNGMFIAVGPAAANELEYSLDGVNWTLGTPVNAVKNLVFSGTEFVLQDTAANIYTSIDGVAWAFKSTRVAFAAMAAGHDVIVGTTANDILHVSHNNGLTWGTKSLATITAATAIVFDPTEGVFKVWQTGVTGGATLASAVGASWVSYPRDGTYAFSIAVSSPEGTVIPGSANDSVSINNYITATTRTISTVNTEVSPAKPVVGSNTASVTVTGISGITSTSSIEAFMMGSDSTTDHNAYEHEITDIDVFVDDIVPGVGFTIYAVSDKRLDGDFAVRYVWAD